MTELDYKTQVELAHIAIPSAATLKKYGMTEALWLLILEAQGGKCAVCDKVPTPNKTTGMTRFVIDHEHVKGWKTMAPEERVRYVRGLTCWYCNSAYLGRGITVDKAQGVVNMLIRHASHKTLTGKYPSAESWWKMVRESHRATYGPYDDEYGMGMFE